MENNNILSMEMKCFKMGERDGLIGYLFFGPIKAEEIEVDFQGYFSGECFFLGESQGASVRSSATEDTYFALGGFLRGDVDGFFSGSIFIDPSSSKNNKDLASFLDESSLLSKSITNLQCRLNTSDAAEVAKLNVETIGDLVRIIKSQTLSTYLVKNITVVLKELGFDINNEEHPLKTEKRYTDGQKYSIFD